MLSLICIVGFFSSKRTFGQLFWLGTVYVVYKISEDVLFLSASYIFVFLSLLLLLVTTVITGTSVNQVSFSKTEHNNSLGVLGFLLFFLGIYRLGFGNLSTTWIYVVEALSNDVTSRISIYLGWMCCLIYLGSRGGWSLSKILSWIVVMSMPLVLRIKLLALPLLLLFVDWRQKKMALPALIRFGAIGLVLYSAVMIFRWSGDLSNISISDLQNTATNVSRAGVEREMSHQFIAVFDYFMFREKLWFDSYLRIPGVIASFIVSIEPSENPMYLYHMISHNNVINKGGSAHPTLFADSFANAGWIGAVLPSLWYLFFDRCGILFQKSVSWNILGMISLVLLIRGSVVYAQFYLFFFFVFYLTSRLFLEVLWKKRY